jgi:hypothetical protein
MGNHHVESRSCLRYGSDADDTRQWDSVEKLFGDQRAFVGHEAIISGRIVGASWRVGERFTWTHDLNREAVATLAEDDNWPWLARVIFALPAPYSRGIYRRQVIHFGLSIKDDPTNRGLWDIWLGKFEAVLRRLYWWSALAQIDTEFAPPRVLDWVPTEVARSRLYDDPPQPVAEWLRSDRVSEQGYAERRPST